MRAPLENIERIDQFINGGMNQAERLAFEAELQNSEFLQQTLDNQLLIQQAIRRKAILQQVELFAPKINSSNVIWTKFKWPIILSTIILGIVSGFAINSQFNSSSPIEGYEHASLNSKGNSGSTISNAGNSGNVISENENESYLANPKLGNSSISEIYRSLDGLQTWIKPDIQYFSINPQKSTTIEGKEGTLIIIPANSIIDKFGNKVQENIQLEIVEALTIDKMLAYNLTTTSHGNSLTSGGMVYIQPKLNGENLSFAENKPCHIEIPCEEYNAEMKAWKGETDVNGNIDWKDPKELKNYLIPVDFATLDFVPVNFRPQFQSQLPYKKYLKSSVALEDSFYYSLSTTELSQKTIGDSEKRSNSKILTPINVGSDKSDTLKNGFPIKVKDGQNILNLSGIPDELIPNTKVEITYGKGIKVISAINKDGSVYFSQPWNGKLSTQVKIMPEGCEPVVYDDVIFSPDKITYLDVDLQNCKSAPKEIKTTCFIDPSSIKALRQPKFAKTFIATKEFEARLRVLHSLKNGQALLEMYVNNLSKNLFEIDKLVADKLTGSDKLIFENFAKQKHTNVDLSNLNIVDLAVFYNESRKKYQAEVKERNDQLEKKTQKELSVLSNKLSDLNQEYYANLDDNKSFKSNPGISLPQIRKSVSNRNSYKVPWNQTGWINIDNFLHELEKGEILLSINADKEKGNKRIYQCINSLKTVIGINKIENVYSAHYPIASNPISTEFQNTYCVGISRDENGLMFASSTFNPYNTSSVDLKWEGIPEEELIVRLQKLSPANKDLVNSLKEEQERVRKASEFKKKQEALTQEFNKIKAEQQKHDAFIQKLKDCIDPCSEKFVRPVEDKSSEVNSENVTITSTSPKVWYSKELGDFVLKNGNFSEEIKNSNKTIKFYITLSLDSDGNFNSATFDNPNNEFAELEKKIIKAISIAPQELLPPKTMFENTSFVRFPFILEFD